MVTKLPQTAFNLGGYQVYVALKRDDQNAVGFLQWLRDNHDALDKTGLPSEGQKLPDWAARLARCAMVLDPVPSDPFGRLNPGEAAYYGISLKQYVVTGLPTAWPWVVPLAERLYEAQRRGAAKRRGRRAASKTRPLTACQVEALERVTECKGNIAEAARQLGVDRKTVKQHMDAGLMKLGRSASGFLKEHQRGKTFKLPTDSRGQDMLASDDEGPAAPHTANGLRITNSARMKIRRARRS